MFMWKYVYVEQKVVTIALAATMKVSMLKMLNLMMNMNGLAKRGYEHLACWREAIQEQVIDIDLWIILKTVVDVVHLMT